MTKKTIIITLLLFFLTSLSIPNRVSAMGSSANVSDQAGWIMLGGLVIVLGIWYLYAKNNTASTASIEPRKDIKEMKLTRERVKENTTPSGELVFLKW